MVFVKLLATFGAGRARECNSTGSSCVCGHAAGIGAAGAVWRLRDIAGFALNDHEKGRAYAERTLGSRELRA